MSGPARTALFSELRAQLPAAGLITEPAAKGPYASDALTMYQKRPLAVALPETSAQVAAVLRICRIYSVPVVTRGAGTGLSGGALPLAEGVLLVTARLNSIVRIDPLARTAVVQPGVRNLAISEAAARYGLFYAPDPSSQVACTIGGNIAENSGGIRCLKYGLTVHNVLQLRWLTVDGTEVVTGGPADTGYDMLALLHGSEGLLGVVIEATVALLPLPASRHTLLCAFDTYAEGGDAVAAIIGAGITPAGLEMMDGLTVKLVDEFLGLGYPPDAALVLICETDGADEDASAELERVKEICRDHRGRSMRIAKSPAERELLWKGRKSALPAVGRKTSDYYCIDGTIPRRQLGSVLEQISALSRKYDLECANVFHAGDGNLHPLIMFRASDPAEVTRAQEFGSAILRACVDAGGTITGEHGVGIEKLNDMCYQFSAAELNCFHQLKRAFDPSNNLNPGKAVPTLQRCAEFGAMHVHEGQLPHPELERF